VLKIYIKNNWLMALDKFAKIVIEVTNQLGPSTLAAKKISKLKMNREYVQM